MIAAFNEAKGSIRHSLSAGQHRLQAQNEAATIPANTDQGQRTIMCFASLPSPGLQVNRKDFCEPEDFSMLHTFCMQGGLESRLQVPKRS